MKKSELVSMIKEEYKKTLKEGKQYDLKKVGGGFGGHVYFRWPKTSEKNLTIDLGLYSGGSKDGFTYPIAPGLREIANNRYKDKEETKYDKLVTNMDKEISDVIVKELKAFESNIEQGINKIVKKYNK